MSDVIFLLDTNILSNAAKKKPIPELTAWLVAQKTFAVPFPALIELEDGVVKVSKIHPEKALEYRLWIDRFLEHPFLYPQMSPAVARHYAELHGCGPLKNLWFVDPRKVKTAKPKHDLFIAAIALAYRLPIATLNSKDFALVHRHCPLPGVFDPVASEWTVPLTRSATRKTSRIDTLAIATRSIGGSRASQLTVA